jgi:hypothetical protein
LTAPHRIDLSLNGRLDPVARALLVSVQTGAIALVSWLMLFLFRSGRKAGSYLLADDAGDADDADDAEHSLQHLHSYTINSLRTLPLTSITVLPFLSHAPSTKELHSLAGEQVIALHARDLVCGQPYWNEPVNHTNRKC